MDKLTMAHDWAMKHGKSETIGDRENMTKYAWAYADAMYEQHEQREKQAAEQKRKEMRELLNANNTFVEREGQYFNDVEWQPDWSQSPASAKWWAMDEDGECNWFAVMPRIEEGEFNYTFDNFGRTHSIAPSFGYTGHWQDSLRKRPE